MIRVMRGKLAIQAVLALLLCACRPDAGAGASPASSAPGSGELAAAPQPTTTGSVADAGAPPATSAAVADAGTGAAPGAAGSDAGAPATTPDGACPADMALVHGWFCPLLLYPCERTVDKSGYRCAEYGHDRRCLGKEDLRRFCIDRYEWPNRVGELPLVYVNWLEAKDHCASVGKRLCRRSEWTLACEGPKRLPYPWGYRRQPSPCNIDRSAVPFDAYALEREADREEELARLWQADPIGSHPNCVSAFGVYDLSGNVDEWTDNLADNPSTKRPSTLNGGYWGPVRDTCRLTTKSHGPNFRFYQVGFRCCRDPLDGAKVGPEGPIGAPEPWLDPDPPNDDAAGEYAPARPGKGPRPKGG